MTVQSHAVSWCVRFWLARQLILHLWQKASMVTHTGLLAHLTCVQDRGDVFVLPACSFSKVGMQARGVADVRQRGALQRALPALSFPLQPSLLQGRTSTALMIEE